MEEEIKESLRRCSFICERGEIYLEDVDPTLVLNEVQRYLEGDSKSIQDYLPSIIKGLLNRRYLPVNLYFSSASDPSVCKVQQRVNEFLKAVLVYCLANLKKANSELILTIIRILKYNKKYYDNRYTNIPETVQSEYLEAQNPQNEVFMTNQNCSVNFFYRYNINFFGNIQGFSKLIEIVVETIPMERIKRIILFIWSFNTTMVEKKWRKLAKDLNSQLITKIKKLTDEEIRLLQRQELKDFFRVYEKLLEQLYGYTKAGYIIENCELDLAMRFLTSKYLEKRIIGISDIINKVSQVKNRERILSNSDKDTLNSSYLLSWIDSHDIIEIIFGGSSHPEIVKRSSDLVKFLYSNSRFNRSNIDKLWDCAFLKHETDRDALIFLFSELAYVLRLPDLQHMFSKIYILDLNEIDTQILGLIKSIALQLSKHLTKSDNDTEKIEFDSDDPWKEQPEHKQSYQIVNQESFGHNDVLDFIWKICQEQTIAAGITFNVAAQALTILKESLIYYCRNERYKFLVKSIENIKRNSSVITSCKLIEDILNSYSNIRSNYDNESKGLIIKNLEKDYHLFSELYTSLLLFKKEAVERAQVLLLGSENKLEESREDSCYTCSSDDNSQESEERGKKHAEVFKTLRVSKDCELNYIDELKARLGFMRYLYVNSSETLQLKHAQVLWEVLIMNAVTDEEHEILFSWLSSTLNIWFSEGIIINEELTHHIFTDLFLKLDPRFISIEGYLCFEKFFVNLNKQHGIISSEYESDIEVRELALLGMQYLWEILLQARQKQVFKSASEFLKKIFKGLKQPQEDAMQELIRNCMEFIGEGSERYRNHADLDAVNQIFRSLSILIDFLQDFEMRNSNDRIEISIQNHIPDTFPKNFTLNVSPVMLLSSLKALVVSRMSPELPSSELILFLNSKKLGSKQDSKSLSEIGITRNNCINVFEANRDFDMNEESANDNLIQLASIFSCYSEDILLLALESVGNNLNEAITVLINEDTVSDFQKRVEQNKIMLKPKENLKLSEIISNSSHNFSLLFQLFEIGHESINSKLWELLVKIPVNQNMHESLKELNDETWVSILSTTCLHKLLYGLKIINSIIVQSNSETQTWKYKFLAKGGFIHLYQILISSQNLEFSGSEKASCLCVELLIRIITHFVKETLEKQIKKTEEEISVLETIDFGCLMTKMLEIIEQCINRELEGTSLIESALDLMLPLIINNPELLSELYQRNSFNSLINYLLDSPKTSVRQAIKFTIANIVEAIPLLPNNLEAPPSFFKKMLLKNLPVGHHEYCDEYFELLVMLHYDIDPNDLTVLDHSLDFILNSPVIEDYRLSNQDKVLTGYLNLSSVIVKSNAEKYPSLVQYLYSSLFDIPATSKTPPPRFKHEITRKAAFRLLFELVRDCNLNKKILYSLLNKNHESPKLLGSFDSEISSRSSSGFVGLRNFGATCYMNSLMQQLFMIKPFREGIKKTNLSVEDPDESLEDNLVYQMQEIFWNLEETDKQYYEPYGFCKAFKDYDGQLMNVKQQQDVDEFFNILCDKIEEILKNTQFSKLLRDCFGGTLVHEIESCEPEFPYKGKREEQFYRISLDIKNKKTLADALDLYVKEDLLDGDNKYFCEEFNCKVTAKKRCVIHALSNTVIIHLKRFEFNYSTMQRIKMNEYFEFPMKLDLKPWSTVEETSEEYYVYDLVGVLVHSGYVDAGHFYSIIKNKENDTWLKFDDKYIDVFDISNLREECFGGENSQHWSSDVINFTKTRNAYVLVYERSIPLEKKDSNEVLNTISVDTSNSIRSKIKKDNLEFLRDKLLFDSIYSEFLLNLIDLYDTPQFNDIPTEFSLTTHICECLGLAGLFSSNTSYEKCTSTELYSISEVMDLHVNVMKTRESIEKTIEDGLMVVQVGTLFALEMLIRGKKTDVFLKWVNKLKDIYKIFAPGCIWLLQYLTQNHRILSEIIIDCRDGEIRHDFKNLLCEVLNISSTFEKDYLLSKIEIINLKSLPYLKEEDNQYSLYKQKYFSSTSRFLKMYLSTLLRRALNNHKSFNEYFWVIKYFSNLGISELKLLLELRIVSKLFLQYISEYGNSLQSNIITMDDEIMIEIAANLLQRSATSCMIISGVYPDNMVNKDTVVLPSIEEAVFFETRSIERLVSLSKHRECRNILIHFAWENLNFSVDALEKFISLLFDFKYDQTRYNNMLKLGYNLLSIQDTIRHERVRAFLTQTRRFRSGINDSNTFFDNLLSNRITNYNFFISVIIWWSDLMNYDHILKETQNFPEKFKTLVSENLGYRHTSNSMFWDYFDNMRPFQLEINKAFAKISELFEPDLEDAEPENNANKTKSDSQPGSSNESEELEN